MLGHNEILVPNALARSTRRQVLTALAVGGALGLLAIGPAAAECGERHHGKLSLAERRRYAEAKKHFRMAVRGFNEMNATPIEASPLWQELDPDVAIYDFDAGNQIMARGLEASIAYLYNKRPYAKFEPVPGTVCFHLHSNPQIVTGQADWKGNDGSGVERIAFTWELKDHLVVSMKGYARPPVA